MMRVFRGGLFSEGDSEERPELREAWRERGPQQRRQQVQMQSAKREKQTCTFEKLKEEASTEVQNQQGGGGVREERQGQRESCQEMACRELAGFRVTPRTVILRGNALQVLLEGKGGKRTGCVCPKEDRLGRKSHSEGSAGPILQQLVQGLAVIWVPTKWQ